MSKKIILFIVVITVLAGGVLSYAQTFGVKKRRPKPHEFGNVVINNYSQMENMAPVVFKHWLHRSKYTCRLCHVDIGFAMAAGQTNITESDNENGLYCGSCHNGKIAFSPKSKGYNGNTVLNCVKCHSLGERVEFKNDFYTFRKNMPKERFGNGINWMKAEDEGLVKLDDFLEGVSIKRQKIEHPKDFQLKPLEKNMPDIIFSHEKHTVWNGCELCHPEIFGVKKGYRPYTMEDIFDGKYCGLCHGPVAFPNIDCQRCHTKMVS